jgi:poly(beta-D-mannuronate) lyase
VKVTTNPGDSRRQIAGTAAIIWLFLFIAVGGASAACPTFAVVDRVDGATFYADKAGSVVDPRAQRRNEELQAPVRKMLGYVETSFDAANDKSPVTDCAVNIIRQWATERALLNPPVSTQGRIERARFVIGLNIIALKLRKLEYPLGNTVLSWLKDLNYAVMDYFEKGTNRANLYIWSGVGAVSFALLTGDRVAAVYEDKVWRASIADITADGFLPKELTRAHRALIYHQYAFSALLMLREMRLALGESESASDRGALHRLAARISSSLCDPRQMAAMSGATQEMPDQTAFRVPDTFGDGLLDGNWAECGVTPPHFNDVNLGGRLDLTARLLETLAADHGR